MSSTYLLSLMTVVLHCIEPFIIIPSSPQYDLNNSEKDVKTRNSHHLVFTEIEEETFNNYRYRFAMPNSDWPIPLGKMWYSLDIGPVHILR